MNKKYPVIWDWYYGPIGYVYKDKYGWNSVCFGRDIGHGSIETREEAVVDVLKLYFELPEKQRKIKREWKDYK